MSKNTAASVRQRLLNHAKKHHEDFQYVLIRYGLERLLYRLSQSKVRDRFILKGASLFTIWTNEPHRATRDIDLLGHGDNSIASMVDVFCELCDFDVEDDGLVFDRNSVKGANIGKDKAYDGLRMTLEARLERAKIPIQVDIGFGDIVMPAPCEIEYPTLLALPQPTLLSYPKETVVAEKFQAMVLLGMGNSRMKDFFDLWVMSREFSFEGDVLADAIQATFERRKTPLPSQTPLALTATFSTDAMKQTQWKAFIRKIHSRVSAVDLAEVTSSLEDFLMPPTKARLSGKPFQQIWSAGGPWQ